MNSGISDIGKLSDAIISLERMMGEKSHDADLVSRYKSVSDHMLSLLDKMVCIHSNKVAAEINSRGINHTNG
jgi:uncharacterized protein YrrD